MSGSQKVCCGEFTNDNYMRVSVTWKKRFVCGIYVSKVYWNGTKVEWTILWKIPESPVSCLKSYIWGKLWAQKYRRTGRILGSNKMRILWLVILENPTMKYETCLVSSSPGLEKSDPVLPLTTGFWSIAMEIRGTHHSYSLWFLACLLSLLLRTVIQKCVVTRLVLWLTPGNLKDCIFMGTNLDF